MLNKNTFLTKYHWNKFRHTFLKNNEKSYILWNPIKCSFIAKSLVLFIYTQNVLKKGGKNLYNAWVRCAT